MRLTQTTTYCLIIAVLWLSACSDDTTTPPTQPSDHTPPADITTLEAGSPTSTTITLDWTAPGDDDMIAKAAEYDIRYSSTSISDANWDQATPVANPPRPTVGGAPQSFVVSGLLPSTVYYFGIETADEVPNWSGLSNIASAKTLLAGAWTVFTVASSDLPSDTIFELDLRGVDRFLGTTAGLARLAGSVWTVYDTVNYANMPGTRIRVVTHDPAGSISLSNFENGFSSFDGTSFVLYNDSTTGEHLNAVRALASNTAGELWIGTANTGLYHLTDSGIVNYNTSSGVNMDQNGVGVLAFDGSGFLWIAYGNGRVARFNGTSFDDPIDVGSRYNIVHAIAADHSGNLWFGSDNGAYKYDGAVLTPYTSTNSGLVDNVVISVTVTPNDERWFATQFGLSRFDGTTWTTYTTANSGLPDNFIWVVRSDQVGNLWLGTNYGLAEFTP